MIHFDLGAGQAVLLVPLVLGLVLRFGLVFALARALALVGDLRVSVSEVVVRNPSDAAKGLNQNGWAVVMVVVVDDDQ